MMGLPTVGMVDCVMTKMEMMKKKKKFRPYICEMDVIDACGA